MGSFPRVWLGCPWPALLSPPSILLFSADPRRTRGASTSSVKTTAARSHARRQQHQEGGGGAEADSHQQYTAPGLRMAHREEPLEASREEHRQLCRHWHHQRLDPTPVQSIKPGRHWL